MVIYSFKLTLLNQVSLNQKINLEIRINEGKRAIVNNVTVIGNTKVKDHVIMREVRSLPGSMFKRSDIIRTQEEFNRLGYFNPETLGVNPVPDPETGTVDIEYSVESKSSDQLELQGGWGNGMVVGAFSVVFNNFSTKNFLKKITGTLCHMEMVKKLDFVPLQMVLITKTTVYRLRNLGWVEPNLIVFLYHFGKQFNLSMRVQKWIFQDLVLVLGKDLIGRTIILQLLILLTFKDII